MASKLIEAVFIDIEGVTDGMAPSNQPSVKGDVTSDVTSNVTSEEMPVTDVEYKFIPPKDTGWSLGVKSPAEPPVTLVLRSIDPVENMKLLTEDELLEIKSIHVEDDYIIPMDLAVKLKGISRQAIYKAIEKGEIVKVVHGVLLRGLLNYKVNERLRENGAKGFEKKVNEKKGNKHGNK